MQQIYGYPAYYGSRLRRNASVPFGRHCLPGGACRVGRYQTADDDDLATEFGVPEPDCRPSDPVISGVDAELQRVVETSELLLSDGLPVSSIPYATRGWG
jgi:hypothetical protein